jgi:hypothetical protein
MGKRLSTSAIAAYRRDGYYFPVRYRGTTRTRF